MGKNNKRQSGKRSFREETNIPKERIDIPPIKGGRTSGSLPLFKTMLIVCEGETEAGYFQALTELIGIKVDVLPIIKPKEERKKNEASSGYSSLRALLQKGSAEMQNKIYDEVWIVLDNDEQNAYKLCDDSIETIESIFPNIGNVLKKNQINPLNVRAEEAEKERIRYFLHRKEYESFLKSLFPLENIGNINVVIDVTVKRNDFYFLQNNRLDLFDKTLSTTERKNLANIRVAYCAISFEHWLLLHYEYNQTAFYNSREYLPYFDSQKYFGVVNSTTGVFEKAFDKGYYLYDERERLKSFFECSKNKAVYNSLQLDEICAKSLIHKGLQFFEINPYCDVHHLIGVLIDTEFLKTGEIHKSYSKYPKHEELLLDNILLQINKAKTTIELSFDICEKQALMQKNIIDALSIIELQSYAKQTISVTFASNQPIYRQGDKVILNIDYSSFKQNFYILSFELDILYISKGKKIVFLIQI